MIAALSVIGFALSGWTTWTGVRRLLRRRWISGVWLLLAGLLGIGAQLALSLIPVGIGEPIIRIRERELWPVAAAGVALAVLAALLTRRRSPMRFWPILAPILLAGAVAGLAFLGTPERERERDPNRRAISLPPGFSATIYAQGAIDNPTVMTFGPTGELYIGDIAGDLWVARRKADSTAETPTRFARGFELLVGLAWKDGELFASSAGKIEALRDSDGDGVADARRLVTGNLPVLVFKPHSNNSLTVGPDGRLYFGVGSTSNTGIETEPLASAILSVSPDGGPPTVVARGFGNPFEMAFNARGDLFTGDNSSATPDGDEPPDTFQYVVPGGQYGASQPAGAARVSVRPALLEFPAHSVPTGLTFYTGSSYPAEYADNAFLAMWSRGELMRITLGRASDGPYRAQATLWGDGFLYPIDIVVGPDGDLYVADFGTSVIYRIRYQGER